MAIDPIDPTAPIRSKALKNGSLDPVLANIQGHILEKHRRDYVWNYLLCFQDAESAQRLATLPCALPSVTDLRLEGAAIRDAVRAGTEVKPRTPVCFLGLSFPGSEFLKLDLKFEAAFQTGFRERASGKLGLSSSDLKEWDPEWKKERYHAVLICAADTIEQLNTLDGELTKHFGQSIYVGLVEKCQVKRGPSQGNTRGHAKEHFEFDDGVSQPVFLPDDADARAASWTSTFDPTMHLSQTLIEDPLNKSSFGSMMAFLKIEQHVDEFKKAVTGLAGQLTPEAAAHLGLTQAEYAATLIIGRHANGQPLIPGGQHLNDFDRTPDPAGSLWPFASHVCKMNPRTLPKADQRPLVRRGVTYDHDGVKGLMFQSFQPKLDGWFEEVIKLWAGDSNFPVGNVGRDPILTRGTDTHCFPSDSKAPVCISGLTTIRGGEYFYFPSIPAIQQLGK